MESLMKRYEKKMVAQGLVETGAPLMAELETQMIWNRKDPGNRVLADVFTALNINSLCFSQPAEPFRTIVDFLASENDRITLKDNETRLFLHDLPVVRKFDANLIAAQLRRRKAVIIAGHGIVTHGTVTIEQCFVTFSSVLFSCFVKFFTDFLEHVKAGRISSAERTAFENAVARLAPAPVSETPLQTGPFGSKSQVYQAISAAGKPIVAYGLVDSVMGNISYRYGDTLYISQTGGFLDELEGCIDPCPLDNSSCTGITASTELPAHMRIVTETAHRAVLHGHPKFAVIMSMICDHTGCEFEGQCHTKCPEPRLVQDIEIVPGESGAGPHALCNTVPEALKTRNGVIVYGHGVFTADHRDFNRPFCHLVEIENLCREAYFKRLQKAGVTP